MINLSPEEKLDRFEVLRRIASKCPIGWHEEKLAIGRWETQSQIIQWLCDLQNACAVDEDGTAQELLRIKSRYPE